jgi:myosin tail region-interacting protein MTI1
LSLSPGEDSDDELSTHTTTKSLNAITSGTVAPTLPPPLPPHVIDQSESSPPLRRSSTYDSTSLKSPAPGLERRLSRGPPPIPGNPPQQSPPLIRPPPPPPPTLPSRQFTSDGRTGGALPAVQPEEDTEGEVTEYDGDYDTDITPGAKFKDALKAHERDSSLDDDVPLHPPRGPENRPPPPLPTAPRAVPPPPPNQPPKSHRVSTLPPPIPLPKEHIDDNEYDYDRHGASPPLPLPPTGRPTPHLPAQQQSPQDGLYDMSPVHSQPHPPPPPPPERMAVAPLPRSSLDVSRGPGNARKSIDISRPSVDQSFIATDIDLAQGGMWWTQPNNPPPIFQNRKDIFYEVEESSLSKRGGKTTISKSVYILFMDYSQTIINARFDARNPVDVLLEQRHEPPPNRPRQDQLESAHIQFGSRISEAVNAIQNTTVADGTPHGLIQHLVSPLTDALLPVGTRAYGALVYANLANASVQQHDEIRAGDIVSFRNARFQGHRGTMHQKYHVEVGKPDHVGIVVDWDGTKKKIHSWEQGRESRKVKTESFKLGDLKSGECKVWRVMPRSWVRWERSKE